MSWAAVSAGVEHGHDTIVLQASPMGFRTAVAYAVFSRPRPGDTPHRV